MTATPSYWLFVAFATVAIATPGPGVLLTVSNALRYGLARSFPGVLGLALGMLGVGAAYLLFPHFVDASRGYVGQLALLALTFSALMVGIHSAYCAAASVAKRRVLSERWTSALNRATGGVFVALGIGAAAAAK